MLPALPCPKQIEVRPRSLLKSQASGAQGARRPRGPHDVGTSREAPRVAGAPQRPGPLPQLPWQHVHSAGRTGKQDHTLVLRTPWDGCCAGGGGLQEGRGPRDGRIGRDAAAPASPGQACRVGVLRSGPRSRAGLQEARRLGRGEGPPSREKTAGSGTPAAREG